MQEVVKKPPSDQLKPSKFGLWLDRFAYTLSPKWGIRRQLHRRVYEKRFGTWEGGHHDRLRGNTWCASSNSIDTQLLDNLPTKQAEALELYRSDPYAHSAVESRVSHEIGTGLTYRPTVRAGNGITSRQAQKINETLVEQMRLVSKYGMDGTGRHSLRAVQSLMCRTLGNYGEYFGVLGTRPSSGAPIPLAIKTIDPFQISTPMEKLRDPLVRLGVQYTDQEEVSGYWVLKSHPNDVWGQMTGRIADYEFIERRDKRGRIRMIHVFEPMFPGQSRGIPWLMAGMNRFKDLGDFLEAEIAAKQLEAMFPVFIKNNGAVSGLDQAEANATETDSQGTRIEEVAPDTIHYLNDGEEVQFGSSQRGSGDLTPFLQHGLRSLAAAGNIPYESLAKDFFRTTFASGRLAMLDGRLAFRMRAATLKEQGLHPIGDELVWWAIANDALSPWVTREKYLDNPDAYERHQWRDQGWQMIDIAKEQAAHAKGVETGNESITSIVEEAGDDFREHMDAVEGERVAFVEMEARVEKRRQELNEQLGIEPEPVLAGGDSADKND